MLIYVDAPSGRTTGVSLRPSDTVGDLKVRIEEEEWIPRDRQCLTYRNGKLEDRHTFESYGIGEGATICLSRPDYAERDEAYYIYVQRTDEKVFRVRIKASDTIGSLKTRLWKGRLIPTDQQHLFFGQQQLEDRCKFSDYNIHESTIIRFREAVYLITLIPGTRSKSGGLERIRVDVVGSETIGNLKVRLWDGELIPRSEQRLIFDGMCLENSRTLSDYNIQEGAEIYLPGQFGAAFPIHIRFPTGEMIRILIEGIDTIGDLKSRLLAWVPSDQATDRPQLIFDGRHLEDKKLVFDYNIQRESTVDLQLPFHMHAPFPNWITESINITIATLTGKRFTILGKGTDTIAYVKSCIKFERGTPPDHQRLIFNGKHLEDGLTISEYGIRKDVTFHLIEVMRAGGGEGGMKRALGLVNIAYAVSLWDWDGIMPGPGNNATGLQLFEGELVTVGRIVNDEWYQGYNSDDICGYFPRAFVSIRKIESSEFKDDIHVDDTPLEKLQVDVKNREPSVEAPQNLLSIRTFLTSLLHPFRKTSKRPLGITSKLDTPPADSDRPDLPPSPVPAPPAFDKFEDGNRVLVQFSLDPKDNQRNYTLRATLSLNSAPGARFSGLTFKVNLIDGTIMAISPENDVGPETEAEVTKDKSHQVSLSTSLQAGSAPVSASIGASTSFTRAEHITFIRKTRGTVQGNGVGSSSAYWVMKEDNGPAAEQGLGPIFDLMVKLNVRPAIISFEVVVHILCDNGKKKTIQSGILSTSV